MDDVAIWWLTEDDCKAVDAFGGEHAGWPEYITTEYASRAGRPGNGRLWQASQIDFNGMDWGVGAAYELIGGPSPYGGIVVLMRDVHHILGWPGIVTDVHMRPLKISKIERGQ